MTEVRETTCNSRHERQIGEQVLVHAVGKESGILVLAHVGEGQHRDRFVADCFDVRGGPGWCLV